jgi:hypothetical protein
MTKHTIALKREGTMGFLSDQSIGTDAFNAMSAIPGVETPEIISESEDRVELSYDWGGEGVIWTIGEHLLKYGLARADSE